MFVNHNGKLLSHRLDSGKIIHSVLVHVVKLHFEERTYQNLSHEVPEHIDLVEDLYSISPDYKTTE